MVIVASSARARQASLTPRPARATPDLQAGGLRTSAYDAAAAVVLVGLLVGSVLVEPKPSRRVDEAAMAPIGIVNDVGRRPRFDVELRLHLGRNTPPRATRAAHRI